MSCVDSVRLASEDGRHPPEHVLTITGHASTEHSPGDEVSITVSAYDETATGSTEVTLAYFHVAADDLYAALDLVLGHSPVRHPDEAVAS